MGADISTVYLHIGTIKTGTTSLQHFLHLNRQFLREKHQIVFPKVPGLKNHTKLPLYAFDHNINELRIRHKLTDDDKLKKFRIDFKSKIQAEIKPYIDKKYDILYTSEHLSSRAIEGKEIESLLSLFNGLEVNIKVIVYLRRQDRMLLSTYSTWVKSGGRWKLNPDAYKSKRYDHLSLLNLWSSIVGKADMIVKVFEKSKMKNQNLYEDFCSIIGIANLDGLIMPAREKLNSSLDESQLEFLRIFNRYVPVHLDGASNKLRGNIVNHLEEITAQKMIKLPSHEVTKINEYFKNDNQIIATEYLRSDETLFTTSDKPDEEEFTSKRLTTESAIEIAAFLWMEQQKKLNSFGWYFKIKNRLRKLFK